MRRRVLLLTASLPLAALLLIGASGPLFAMDLLAPPRSPRGGRRSSPDAGETGSDRAVAPSGQTPLALAAASAPSRTPERAAPIETRATAASPTPSGRSAPSAAQRAALDARWEATRARLDRLVRDAARRGVVGLAVRGPRGEVFGHEATRPMAMASLYKLLVLAAVHDAVARRRLLAWTQRVVLHPEDVREGSRFRPGESYTVHALVDGMVAESDNGAAIALLRTVGGADRANEMARQLGLADTAMVDGRGAADRLDGYNHTTADDMARYFAHLLEGAFVDRETSAEMLARIEKNRIRDRLPALLPAAARVATKPGDLPGIRNDAGVLYTPAGPIVVAALTFGYPDAAASTRFMNELGLALWEYGSVG